MACGCEVKTGKRGTGAAWTGGRGGDASDGRPEPRGRRAGAARRGAATHRARLLDPLEEFVAIDRPSLIRVDLHIKAVELLHLELVECEVIDHALQALVVPLLFADSTLEEELLSGLLHRHTLHPEGDLGVRRVRIAANNWIDVARRKLFPAELDLLRSVLLRRSHADVDDARPGVVALHLDRERATVRFDELDMALFQRQNVVGLLRAQPGECRDRGDVRHQVLRALDERPAVHVQRVPDLWERRRAQGTRQAGERTQPETGGGELREQEPRKGRAGGATAEAGRTGLADCSPR